jgi:phosphomannomutase
VEYIERYETFFSGSTLRGRRILVYQHSAVGRDLLVDLLEHLGAEVIARGRSEKFVPIDTEAIDDAQLAALQAMADEVALDYGPLWAVVSTDGDSDRPLILGVEARRLRFFGGDLVGMVVAEYLGADAVVVPISCNDAIDRGRLAPAVQPKTRIGSPYVIAGMAAACRKGGVVCGWEANGGFLLGSDIERNRRVLRALPTRDAVLPILAVLFSARGKNISLPELFSRLPNRFSRAGLVRDFPRAHGRRIVELLTGSGNGNLSHVTRQLEEFFPPAAGFSAIARIDYTDGVRIIFANGEVAHFRPSGNADEFRIYAVADTQARANEIVDAGIAEPGGIIRSMERALIG